MDLSKESEATPHVITHGWASLAEGGAQRWDGRVPHTESIRDAVCATVVHSTKKSPGLANGVLGFRQHWSCLESADQKAFDKKAEGAFISQKSPSSDTVCVECVQPTNGSFASRQDLKILMESLFVSRCDSRQGGRQSARGPREEGLMMPTASEVGHRVHVSDLGSDVGSSTFSYVQVGPRGVAVGGVAQHTPMRLDTIQREALEAVMRERRESERYGAASAAESASDTATVIHTPAAAPAQPSAAQRESQVRWESQATVTATACVTATVTATATARGWTASHAYAHESASASGTQGVNRGEPVGPTWPVEYVGPTWESTSQRPDW
jgi:hypothetical protein